MTFCENLKSNEIKHINVVYRNLLYFIVRTHLYQSYKNKLFMRFYTIN